jgi:predicted permease
MGKLLRRIRHLLNRERLERELGDEMAAHLAMMPPERRAAFGGTLRFHDESREIWGWQWLDSLRQDLICAARGLRRDRRFALSALATISLAVGAATAVFSVVDRSLFRPLPYSDGSRLVSVGMIIPPLGPSEFMFASAYRDWRVSQAALDFTSWSGVAECDLCGDIPQRLNCARAEASFLPLLGVRPILGRNFSAEEDQRGAEPVALLSWQVWRTSFGGASDVVGKKIILDGVPARIIGVLPENFETPDLTPADLLVPQKLPQGPNTRNYPLTAVGRLHPGHTSASAAAALASPFERFRADFGTRVGGDFAKSMQLRIEPLRDQQIRHYRLALWVLLGAVLAFVLIACVNVANLLLARSAGRRQEFAIRAALGGSRRRLAGLLLTESALLGLAGGAAGCGLAWGLLRAIIALAPDATLRIRDATLDARVLAFAMVLSLGTALVFGLAPSLNHLRVEALGGERVMGSRRTWLREALITSQLAVSLVLLAGAGLLLMSLWRLQQTPLGFSRERVVTASFTLPAYRYGQNLRPTGWLLQQFNFFGELETVLQHAPGVIAAAITDSMPPGPATRTAPYAALANLRGKPAASGTPGSVKWRYVSMGYFEAMGIPIRRGRSFAETDRVIGVRNIVVSESLARRLLGDGDPIGKRLGASTVIGVAGDVRNAGLDREADPEFYQVRKLTGEGTPGSGDDAWWRRATAIVRTNLGEREAMELLRAAIRNVDPAVPVEVKTMEARVGAFLVRPRFQTTLLSMFALTGLTLAGIGLYGLVSFLAAGRTREIGVRIAIGATPVHVVRLVIADGVRWTAVGTIFGIAASVGLLRVLRGLLYEVEFLDLRVFAGTIAVLVSVAVLAAWLPARRASRIDPICRLAE